MRLRLPSAQRQQVRKPLNPVICSIARTPVGRFGDAFAPLTAMDLGGIAIAGALDRAALAPEQVDEVIFGHVIQAGQDVSLIAYGAMVKVALEAASLVEEATGASIEIIDLQTIGPGQIKLPLRQSFGPFVIEGICVDRQIVDG